MKQIVVDLLALGLVFGLLLGCQLKEPTTSDQTQESSSKMTISDDGYFGEELTETTYENEDKYDYQLDGDGSSDGGSDPGFGSEKGDDRFTVTFSTDGTWEVKKESWEGKAIIGGADDDDDDDNKNNEGWVQVDGIKGAYSYDPETKMLTVYNTGQTWDQANDKYNDKWDKDNEPALDNDYSFMVPVIFNVDNFLIDDVSPSGQSAPTLNDLKRVVGYLNKNYYLEGGKYTTTKKRWNTAGSWSDKEFTIVYRTEVFVFNDDDDMITHWYEGYEEDTTATSNEYTDPGGLGPNDKHFYSFTKFDANYDISSGNEITFSAIDGLYSLSANDFDQDKAKYTWDDDKPANRSSVADETDTDTDGYIEFDDNPQILAWEAVVDVSGDGDYIMYLVED
jgi:hypothetical protein